MSGHFICEYCGHDGDHADYCQELRPVEDRWKGHRTKEEMAKLRRKSDPQDDAIRALKNWNG